MVTGLASDERDEKEVVVRRRGVWSEVLSIWEKLPEVAGAYLLSQARQGGHYM